MDNIPQYCRFNCIIIMDKYMAHRYDVFPTHFRVRVFKFLCQFICSFTYYLNIMNRCMIYEFIFNQAFVCHTFRKLKYIINGSKNMFQPTFVPNWLSHKSVFYHGLQSQQRMATMRHPQQDQHSCPILLPVRLQYAHT